MKKCDNWTVQMNIDLDERLQKERVEGRILMRKMLCKKLSLASLWSMFLSKHFFVGIIIIWSVLPVKSNISSMKDSPYS